MFFASYFINYFIILNILVRICILYARFYASRQHVHDVLQDFIRFAGKPNISVICRYTPVLVSYFLKTNGICLPDTQKGLSQIHRRAMRALHSGDTACTRPICRDRPLSNPLFETALFIKKRFYSENVTAQLSLAVAAL